MSTAAFRCTPHGSERKPTMLHRPALLLLLALSLFSLPILTPRAGAAPPTVSTLYSFRGNDTDGGEPTTRLTQGTDGAFYGTAQGGRYNAGMIFKINSDGSGFTDLHDLVGNDGQAPSALVQGTDGAFYGTARLGGAGNYGTVFRISADGSQFTTLHAFGGSDGGEPQGVVQGTDGSLYGVTQYGGANSSGAIFKVGEAGSGFVVLHSFRGSTEGSSPEAALIQGADGAFYGTTSQGGTSGDGTVFRVTADGLTFTVLNTFAGTGGDGSDARSPLVQGVDGVLYGTTSSGGSGSGIVFAVNTDGSGYQILHSFAGGSSDGAGPSAGLILGSDGSLYGTTVYGGANSGGTVFVLSTDGTFFSLLHSFGGSGDGRAPQAALIQGSDGQLYGTTADGNGHRGTVFSIGTDGSGYGIVHAFSQADADGSGPTGALAQGPDGLFYGLALTGGTEGYGTAYRIAGDGSGYTVLHQFIYATDGGQPTGRLALGRDGFFYGVAYIGGPSGNGTIFKMAPDGSGFTVIHVFDYSGPGGRNPHVGLTLGPDGAFYGVTQQGGNGGAGMGVVYRVTADGSSFTALHTFTSGGYITQADSALALGSDGFLYGVTPETGPSDNGSLFKIKPDGSGFVALHAFNNSDGSAPNGVVQGPDGAFYGTTNAGGTDGQGVLFKINADGSGFAVLHEFVYGGDVTAPVGTLTLAADGFFYGTSFSGGTDAQGTVFKIKLDGTGYALMYSFTGYGTTGSADGDTPLSGLTLGSDGLLYGTTPRGGMFSRGIVYRVNLAVSHTHLLWNKTDGTASLWTINPDHSYTSVLYGPYAGWTARATAAAPDGTNWLLWTNTNGTASLWHVTALTATGYSATQYGPYPGYRTVSLSVGSDGSPHLLWDKTDGTALLWTVSPTNGTFTYTTYGPYTGWTANAVASGATVTDLLWNKTDGTASGYRIAANGSLTYHLFGPYPGYTATALSVGPDDGAHLLWDKTDGTALLWNVDFTSGTFMYTSYGPFSGYAARAIATGSDAVTHILWDNANGTASLWSVTGSGYSYTAYGPFAGWTAVGVSAGP